MDLLSILLCDFVMVLIWIAEPSAGAKNDIFQHEISTCLTDTQKVNLTCDYMKVRPTSYRIVVNDVTHYYVPGICGVQQQMTSKADDCQEKEAHADDLANAMFVLDCNGKDSCQVTTSAIFLSKCKTKTNYLHVSYTCVPESYFTDVCTKRHQKVLIRSNTVFLTNSKPSKRDDMHCRCTVTNLTPGRHQMDVINYSPETFNMCDNEHTRFGGEDTTECTKTKYGYNRFRTFEDRVDLVMKMKSRRQMFQLKIHGPRNDSSDDVETKLRLKCTTSKKFIPHGKYRKEKRERRELPEENQGRVIALGLGLGGGCVVLTIFFVCLLWCWRHRHDDHKSCCAFMKTRPDNHPADDTRQRTSTRNEKWIKVNGKSRKNSSAKDKVSWALTDDIRAVYHRGYLYPRLHSVRSDVSFRTSPAYVNSLHRNPGVGYPQTLDSASLGQVRFLLQQSLTPDPELPVYKGNAPGGLVPQIMGSAPGGQIPLYVGRPNQKRQDRERKVSGLPRMERVTYTL